MAWSLGRPEVTWLWRWLLHWLLNVSCDSNRHSQDSSSQMIIFTQGILLLGSNRVLSIYESMSHEWMSQRVSTQTHKIKANPNPDPKLSLYWPWVSLAHDSLTHWSLIWLIKHPFSLKPFYYIFGAQYLLTSKVELSLVRKGLYKL